MSELYRINKSTLDDIGAALKEVKNVDTSVRVADIGDDIRGLKGTASADKVFAGEEFVGVNGKEVGAFTIDSELSSQDVALDELEGMVDACLGGEPIVKENKFAKLVDRSIEGEITEADLQGLTRIGTYAFRDCQELTSIEIPDSVTSIGDGAFYDCKGITSVIIGNGVTSISANTFYNCYGLSSINMSNIKSIGSHAFFTCKNLTSIDIENVTQFGTQVFSYCFGLTSIKLPDTITSIANGMFSYCSGLTNVTIPSSVKEISFTAFGNCSGLQRIKFLPTTPPTIQSNTFEKLPSTCVLEVPADSIEAYKAKTNLSKYADQMVASTDF